MRHNLDDTEEMRKKLEEQLQSLSAEDTDLLKERQLRKRLERKLQIAEDSLKRLDAALKRNGVKMDVDVFADVKTLMSFFEERADEVRRDAQRIDIMKKALMAKRRYLVASAKADSELADVAGLEEAEDDGWGDDDDDSPPPAAAPAPVVSAPPPVAVTAAPASTTADEPPPADDEDDEKW
jgi:ferritin-like metal-binding protein YciE